jgi:hypothetical protein
VQRRRGLLERVLRCLEPPCHFNHRERGDVQEGTNGDDHLLVLRRRTAQDLQHELLVLQLHTEGLQGGLHTRKAQREILHCLAVLERGELELPAKLLRTVLLDTFVADAHGGDGLPRHHHRFLVGDRPGHLRGDRRAQRVERHNVFLVVDVADVDCPP